MLSKRVCLKSGSVYIGLLLETFQKLKQQTLNMAHVWSLHVYLGPVPEEHSYCGLQWHASSFVPVSARGTPFCFHSCLSLSQMIFLLLSAYSSLFFFLFIYLHTVDKIWCIPQYRFRSAVILLASHPFLPTPSTHSLPSLFSFSVYKGVLSFNFMTTDITQN